MCCCNITTEVLMANFFAAICSRSIQDPTIDRAYSIKDLKTFLDWISARFPVYVTSNFSSIEVHNCVERHSDLYVSVEINGEYYVKSGEFAPNLDYFRPSLPESIVDYLKNISNLYVSELTTG